MLAYYYNMINNIELKINLIFNLKWVFLYWTQQTCSHLFFNSFLIWQFIDIIFNFSLFTCNAYCNNDNKINYLLSWGLGIKIFNIYEILKKVDTN